MARIRTIKPEFFRHEGLQDLEAANPGAYVMLVFAGLWGHCDRAGRFRWKPRTLKLDILPFLDFDLAKTLALLREAGFVRQYRVDDDEYGEIPSFTDHQRLNGKEAQEPEKYPACPEGYVETHQGSTGEAPGKHLPAQEGKGREEEGNGEVARERAPTAPRLPDDWAPDPDLLAWAANAEPGVDARREVEKFRDYWKAASGANARKHDWSAAWRTWIRRAAEIQSVRPPPPRAQARDGPAKSSGGGLASISEAGEAFLERVAAEARARQKQAGAAG